MPTTSISVSFKPLRMLNKAEAANYCSISANKFDKLCPVDPIKLPNGKYAWDVHDLDKWLDSLKADRIESIDQIISRLA